MRALIEKRQAAAAQKPPRRRRRISLWKTATVAALAAPWVVIASLVGVVAWAVWSEGGPNSLAARMKSEALLASLRLGFEIEEVWVDGLKRTDRYAALQAIGAVRGEPILEFNPEAARERLAALPWVKDAVVALALPRQIHVALTEREPLALWQIDRKLTVIDRDGDVIPGIDPLNYAGLPILVGKGADKQAAALFDLVAHQPAIADRLTAAVFIAGRRWNIRIDDRIDVRLPADAPEAALTRLAALEQEHSLFGKDIVAIDLRLEDRLIVRMAPGAAQAASDVDGRQG